MDKNFKRNFESKPVEILKLFVGLDSKNLSHVADNAVDSLRFAVPGFRAVLRRELYTNCESIHIILYNGRNIYFSVHRSMSSLLTLLLDKSM